MRRTANGVFKSLKDQVRVVRYSIRAEAEEPGSTLPEALHDLKPVMAIGRPALRLANGLFTEVETFAEHLLQSDPAPGFPLPLQAFLDRTADASSLLYAPYNDILAASGVRAALVSERSLDQAGDLFRDRQSDLAPRSRTMTSAEVVRASAALIHALAEARPVRKMTFGAPPDSNPNVMLSPNLFCAAIVGIASGIVTLKPEPEARRRTVLQSARSVVDARFHRLKRALVSKTPEADLAKELEVLLPFLP